MSKHNTNYASVNNYILLANTMDTLKSQAKNIANQVRISCPAGFNAEKAFIEYEMAYVPPFDKHFDVLFRLQGIAAEESRFQDEYRGYIILDISKYLQHEKEDWFDIALKFFHDQNDVWKYIFLVDMSNIRAGTDMISKILSLIYCRVQDLRESDEKEQKRFIQEQCETLGISFSKSTELFLEALVSKKEYSRDMVVTFLKEIADRFGNEKTITVRMINKHIESGESVVRYMLSTAEYALFLELLEDCLQKGVDYDEKI